MKTGDLNSSGWSGILCTIFLIPLDVDPSSSVDSGLTYVDDISWSVLLVLDSSLICVDPSLTVDSSLMAVDVLSNTVTCLDLNVCFEPVLISVDTVLTTPNVVLIILDCLSVCWSPLDGVILIVWVLMIFTLLTGSSEELFSVTSCDLLLLLAISDDLLTSLF